MHDLPLLWMARGLRGVSCGCGCLTTQREKQGGAAFAVAGWLGLSSGGKRDTLEESARGGEAGICLRGAFPTEQREDGVFEFHCLFVFTTLPTKKSGTTLLSPF